MVALFENLPSEAPTGSENEKIGLTDFGEEFPHLPIGESPVLPLCVGCHGLYGQAMCFRYFLNDLLQCCPHPDPAKRALPTGIVASSRSFCPMTNDSVNQCSLRVKRVDDVGDPHTESAGAPGNVVYVEIRHGGADDTSRLVVDGIVDQTHVEV